MAEQFIGKWKLESSENFDAYMKAVGVNIVMAKLGSTAKPTVTFSIDGDTWTVKTETTFKSSTVVFTLDNEFDETTADDRKMKTTMTLNGNTLTQDQKGEIPSVITRQVQGDTMTCVCKAKDVTSTRIYKKAAE